MPDFLLWDTYLSPENPEKKYLAPMRDSMLESMAGRARHILTHESNLIMKGQKVSRAGAIGGIRLVFDIGTMNQQSSVKNTTKFNSCVVYPTDCQNFTKIDDQKLLRFEYVICVIWYI